MLQLVRPELQWPEPLALSAQVLPVVREPRLALVQIEVPVEVGIVAPNFAASFDSSDFADLVGSVSFDPADLSFCCPTAS